MELSLDPARTALVVIDLQKGIATSNTQPRPGAEVVENVARIATALKRKGGFVVLVHVTPSPDRKDSLHPITDAPPAGPAQTLAGGPPPDFAEIFPELIALGDIVLTKRQWGAFYGTELDLQLRRRGIDTILLGGISTSMGVESTARDAFERGYQQIFVEDAMAARVGDEHRHTVDAIFPKIGRVRSTAEVLAALA